MPQSVPVLSPFLGSDPLTSYERRGVEQGQLVLISPLGTNAPPTPPTVSPDASRACCRTTRLIYIKGAFILPLGPRRPQPRWIQALLNSGRLQWGIGPVGGASAVVWRLHMGPSLGVCLPETGLIKIIKSRIKKEEPCTVCICGHEGFVLL